MTPERWQQIETLYHDALEQAPAARSAFLRQACGEDALLHSEVESLLASHDQAASFIESSPDDVVAGMMAEKQTSSMIGRTLGHYQISSLLGAGGMGEVYRARDLRLDRDVAVKILPEHLAQDAEALRRFEREAKAVAALSHPNILSIFDFGSEDGVSYAVMEFLEGETLRDCLKRSPMRWRQAAEIGIAITEGLAAAHAKNIIHRDLKPENIFLTNDGGVKILDFGIARMKRTVKPDSETLTAPHDTTRPGLVMGTLSYMSPEQVRGQAVEAQSDIFSFGCVLYEMVGGHRPFSGETGAEIIAAILKEDPPRLTESAKDIPPELERIINHCLEKLPEQRFQSARELARNLRTMLSGNGQLSLPTTLRRQQIRPALWLGSAASILLIGLAVWLFWRSVRVQEIDSLAVLPLVNASGDADLEYLSDGITESLINNLSQLPKLRVMARGTVFSYKGKEVDPRKVGQELKVRTVFTGRMVQRDDILNIQADLVNASDGSQIWGNRYTRKLPDAQAILEEITKQITDKLRLELTVSEQQLVVKRHTENPEAYRLYLKGRFYSNQFTTEGLKKGIAHLNQAVELDPTYALAHAGLSASYFDASNFLYSPDEAMPKVKAAALLALQLDERIAETHISLAQYYEKYEFNWDKAEKQYKRAMELNPNYARAFLWYGVYLAEQGRVDEAITSLYKACELDPLNQYSSSTLAWAYYLSRRTDEAITQLRKMISMNSNFPVARYTLGMAYRQKGMYEKAISEFNEAQHLDQESWIPVALSAHTYAVWGKRDEARRRLDELKRTEKQKHVDPYNIGVIHAALGENDQAFEWFNKAFQARSEELLTLKVDPRVDGLKSDPRFKDLLRRMRLSE